MMPPTLKEEVNTENYVEAARTRNSEKLRELQGLDSI